MTGRTAWQTHLVENAALRLQTAAIAIAEEAEQIARAGAVLGEALAAGRRVLACGNGGSAACAQHFAAEFSGKLAYDRAPLSGIALSTDTSALTAIANDFGYDEVFARQVHAHGRAGDVLVGLSTSGTSANVRRAMETARELGLVTIALTGPHAGLGGDHEITVSVRETARVQEVHDLILHELAQIAERVVFEDLGDDPSADRFPFVIGPEDLDAFRAWMTSSKQSLVTTNGVFDLLHEGHLASLGSAARLGDRLVVLVNSDESVRRLKGDNRPIQALEQRLGALRRTGLIAHVVVLDADDPVALLETLRPEVHCKGVEYAERPMPERAVIERNGGRVELLGLEAGHSTTAVIERSRRA